MEEKLFWISLCSGGVAFIFKRFLGGGPRSLDRHAAVVGLNTLFWSFVGVAAGFLVVSYKELGTLNPLFGAASGVAGGALGALWAMPVRKRFFTWSTIWGAQGAALALGLGGLLGLPRAAIVVGMLGLGLLGLAAAQWVHVGPAKVGRSAMSGFLAAEGALAGYWFSTSGGGSASMWVWAGLAAGGYYIGRGWRPRSSWDAEGNETVMRESLEWADTGFSAILLASVIMYFVVQAFKIPSGSMRSTLLEGDHLFVNKFIYGVRVPYTGKRVFRFRPVRRGDVVVFRFPTRNKNSPHYGKDFIKRAIGLPGDTIEIRDKRVFVNGLASAEPYVQFEDPFVIPPSKTDGDFQRAWVSGELSTASTGEMVRDNFGPVVVPEHSYFVMGDNRDRSYDGRFWGPMPDSHLKGRAWLLYLPFSRWKIIR